MLNWQVAVGLVCRERLFDVCTPAEETQRRCIDRLFALMNDAFTGPVAVWRLEVTDPDGRGW